MARLIAITGGIGCGKSVVCKVLAVKGFTVIDTDALARQIMDSSLDIKERLKREIHPGAVDENGIIDRRLIAGIVFEDSAKLKKLNKIVHSSVLKELKQRAAGPAPADVIFVETALLFQSRLNRLVDAEISVYAPLHQRIERVMARNGLSATEVKRRIKSQLYCTPAKEPRPLLIEINNSDNCRILPQICEVLFWLDIPPFGPYA